MATTAVISVWKTKARYCSRVSLRFASAPKRDVRRADNPLVRQKQRVCHNLPEVEVGDVRKRICRCI